MSKERVRKEESRLIKGFILKLIGGMNEWVFSDQ